MQQLINDLTQGLHKLDAQLRLLTALAAELEDDSPQLARVSLAIAKRVGKREILLYTIQRLTARVPPPTFFIN